LFYQLEIKFKIFVTNV